MVIDSYIDLFSGTGCFPLAMRMAGIKIRNHYFSEIDKQAIANYKYNFPNAQYIGSVESVLSAGIKSADFITFGFPCQDLSQAGNRRGLESGTRSALFFKAVEIIDYFRPATFLAENVAGLLTHAKRSTIITVLDSLAFLFQDSPQYNIESELLNTRAFGIPQNRERIYFKGTLRSGSGREVFPLGNCSEANNEKGLQRSDSCGTINIKNNSGQLSVDSGTVLVLSDRGIGGNSGGNHSQSELIQLSETSGNADAQRVYDSNGIARTIKGESGGQGGKTGLYEVGKRVRRLTPLEVERCFGMPDNWTKYGINEKGQYSLSDTARYKLCGNGISTEPLVTIFKAIKEIATS